MEASLDAPFVGSFGMQARIHRHRSERSNNAAAPASSNILPLDGFAALNIVADTTVSPPSQASPNSATPAGNAAVFGGDKRAYNGDNWWKLRRVEPGLRGAALEMSAS
jgi:hypothetical protein